MNIQGLPRASIISVTTESNCSVSLDVFHADQMYQGGMLRSGLLLSFLQLVPEQQLRFLLFP